MIKQLLACLIACAALYSCNRADRLPSSIGQPYEVVLVGDSDSIITRMLQQDVEGLPQSEPLFNIIQVRKGHDKGMYTLARTRIIVDVDKRNQDYDVQQRKDAQAMPQIALTIKAHSVEQLQKKLDAKKLRALLDAHELKHLISIIKPNTSKQKEVKKLFGIDIKIPLDMESSKRGKDFLWLSNNANTGMQNLLFFRVKETGKDKKEHLPYLKSKIDSVLLKNMPGEVDGMYMQLSNISESSRGLWEMKGDAMGGPYVMKVLSTTSHRGESRYSNDVIIIGFVYAPEMRKRNLIKQLEAVLASANPQSSSN